MVWVVEEHVEYEYTTMHGLFSTKDEALKVAGRITSYLARSRWPVKFDEGRNEFSFRDCHIRVYEEPICEKAEDLEYFRVISEDMSK